jgi:GntR family transcriptional regulator
MMSCVTTSPATGPRRPLYLEAAERLGEMIRTRTFESVLPSQDRLCELLNVSRPTVREAIRVLEQSGLVSTRQGAATTINPAPRVQAGLEELTSQSELLTRAGYEAGTSYLDVRRTIATPGSFSEFAGRPIFVIERLRTADGTPFVFSIDVIADAGYDAEALSAAVREGSLMAWLEMQGIGVAYARTDISAAAAHELLAERLEVRVGTPLLFLEVAGYASDDTDPIYTSNDFYRSDLARFYVVRRRRLR